MNLGENIKKYRKEKGMTQEELANKCGLSKNGLWNYENGKREPNIDTLNKIATVLNISLTDLVYVYIPPQYFNDSKLNEIIKSTGELKGLLLSENYSKDELNNIVDKIFYLCKNISSLDHLKELLSTYENDYDLNKLSDEDIDIIYKEVMKTIDYQLYNLDNE